MIDNKYSTYSNPLTERYCSKNMSYIFYDSNVSDMYIETNKIYNVN